MSVTASVLILTDNAKLREECDSALGALGEEAPRHRFVADRNELFEAVRTRPPELVLVEFPHVPKELSGLVRELATACPSAMVVAILRPEGFGDGVSESGVLIEAMRAGVRDFLRRPISTSDLRRLLDACSAPEGAPSTARNGGASGPGCRVVSFISNKGGVGKSTLATNAAVSLARRHPGRVLLIDASLQMGVAAALLDLNPQASLTDLARERDRLDATLVRQLATVHSSGLHLLAAPADAVEAMEVDDLLLARVIMLARQSYEFVVIDTFPMFDRVVVAALDLSDRAYVVLENVVPTLLGGIRLLDVLERIGFPADRQSVIVNRHQRVTGSLSLSEVATRLGRSIDHVLPFDKRVMTAANAGEPIALEPLRFGGFARSLQRLVDDIAQLASQPVGSDAFALDRRVQGGEQPSAGDAVDAFGEVPGQPPRSAWPIDSDVAETGR